MQQLCFHLDRKSASVPKRFNTSAKLADPNSYVYKACGDERAKICSSDLSGNIKKDAVDMDRLMDIAHWLRSFIIRKAARYTTIWLPSTSENPAAWLHPKSSHNQESSDNLIQTRAISSGSVAQIWPSYSSFIGDFKVVKWWTREADFYQNIRDRRKARGLNDRFMNLLCNSPYALLDDVKPLGEIDSDVDDGPKLFFGSPTMVGLAPSNAREGDLIAQYWNTNAAVVLRNGTNGNLETIGRALIVRELYDFDWDAPRDIALFQNASNTVDLAMSLSTLTRLSLDSVYLDHTVP